MLGEWVGGNSLLGVLLQISGVFFCTCGHTTATEAFTHHSTCVLLDSAEMVRSDLSPVVLIWYAGSLVPSSL